MLHETIAALIEWIVKAELGSGEDGEEEKGNEEKRPWVNVLLMLSEGLQVSSRSTKLLAGEVERSGG